MTSQEKCDCYIFMLFCPLSLSPLLFECILRTILIQCLRVLHPNKSATICFTKWLNSLYFHFYLYHGNNLLCGLWVPAGPYIFKCWCSCIFLTLLLWFNPKIIVTFLLFLSASISYRLLCGQGLIMACIKNVFNKLQLELEVGLLDTQKEWISCLNKV